MYLKCLLKIRMVGVSNDWNLLVSKSGTEVTRVIRSLLFCAWYTQTYSLRSFQNQKLSYCFSFKNIELQCSQLYVVSTVQCTLGEVTLQTSRRSVRPSNLNSLSISQKRAIIKEKLADMRQSFCSCNCHYQMRNAGVSATRFSEQITISKMWNSWVRKSIIILTQPTKLLDTNSKILCAHKYCR